MYADPFDKHSVQQLKRFITKNITQVDLCMSKVMLGAAVELTGSIASLNELTICMHPT